MYLSEADQLPGIIYITESMTNSRQVSAGNPIVCLEKWGIMIRNGETQKWYGESRKLPASEALCSVDLYVTLFLFMIHISSSELYFRSYLFTQIKTIFEMMA